MAKKFVGSWVIVIILILLCWPAALIYFFIKYEEQPTFGPSYGAPPQPYQQAPPQQYQPNTGYCQKCGAALEPGAQFCQKCGNRTQ